MTHRTEVLSDPAIPEKGAVRRALFAYAAPNVAWIMTCNWVTMVLMAFTIHWLQPQRQSTALQWLAAGTVYSLIFVLWRVRNTSAPAARLALFYTVATSGFSLLWAAVPLLFFDPENFAFSMFMLTIQGGLAAASAPVFATWLVVYCIWVIPPFFAQIGMYWFSGFGEVYWGFGVGLLILLVSQLVFARNHQRTIVRSIRLSLHNNLLVQQLEEKTKIAESANRAKTMFLAAASHDLRQPVYALTLFLDALGGTRLTSQQRHMVQHAVSANQASNEMLRTLLDFSRVEAGVLNPQFRRMALAPMLAQLAEEFGPQAFRMGLLYRSRPSAAWVTSDPQLVAMVLRNLISNALRYTPAGGVLVAVRQRQGRLAIQVWDTGIGIAPDKHTEVFKEFLQLGNAERDHRKGLGMGLAISEGLARNLNARIGLASRPARGSVFSLELPADGWRKAPRDEEPKAIPIVAVDEMPGRDSDLRGLKILVVEDDETVREGMQTLLGQWGCDVVVAEGLNDAVACAARRTPELLITDYRLRLGTTGGDVIRVLREGVSAGVKSNAVAPMPWLRAIIITGDTHPERLREARNHDALLLHKPLDAAVLKAAVLQGIERANASNAAQVADPAQRGLIGVTSGIKET